MTAVLPLLPWFAGAYLLGAIPTSYLVVRAVKGIDLRTVGSGNLGATNLFRQLGWPYAIPVGLFDMLKGFLPVLLASRVLGAGIGLALALGSVAILGHVYSVFVGFRGGKGVATAAGVVLALAPGAFLASLLVWALLTWLTGYVSLASILAAAVFPLAAWILHPAQRGYLWMHLTLAALLIVLHRANIRRLIAGTEHRVRARPRGAT